MTIFDLEDKYSNEESKVQIIPVRWDATASFRKGACYGPRAIFNASKQVELFDLDVRDPWKQGIHWQRDKFPISNNDDARQAYAHRLPVLDELCEIMNEYVRSQTKEIFERDQIPFIVGGDHSVAYGAYAAVEKDFSILQIDAHMDLREAYEGCKWSHASVMFNALKLDKLKRIVQVGVRDFCEEEYKIATNPHSTNITTYYDDRLRHYQDQLKISWTNLTRTISNSIAGYPIELQDPTVYLGKDVWISIDIDGLDPKLCPNTGTPVPGGLDFWQLTTLCRTVARNHRIIGVDIVEVAPDTRSYKWPSTMQHGDGYDEIVGSRILYKLAAYALASQDHNLWWSGDSS